MHATKMRLTFQYRTRMWLRGAVLNINHLVSINPITYIVHQRNVATLKEHIIAASAEASPGAAASRKPNCRGYMPAAVRPIKVAASNGGCCCCGLRCSCCCDCHFFFLLFFASCVGCPPSFAWLVCAPG